MKIPILAILGLVAVPCCRIHASENQIVMIPLPLRVQGEVSVTAVPFVLSGSLPEAAFFAMGVSYVPPSISYLKPGDINLISIAGISIKPESTDGNDYNIRVDYTNVAKAYRTPALLRSIFACVRQLAADQRKASGGVPRKTTIFLAGLESDSPLHEVLGDLQNDKGEGGADQPATAPVSKSEGKDKPQPESEAAPR
jgi:hypothetical protein